MPCSEIYSSGRKGENLFLIFPLALAKGAWGVISVFFLHLLCLVTLLSWRRGIFFVPSRPLQRDWGTARPLCCFLLVYQYFLTTLVDRIIIFLFTWWKTISWNQCHMKRWLKSMQPSNILEICQYYYFIS